MIFTLDLFVHHLLLLFLNETLVTLQLLDPEKSIYHYPDFRNVHVEVLLLETPFDYLHPYFGTVQLEVSVDDVRLQNVEQVARTEVDGLIEHFVERGVEFKHVQLQLAETQVGEETAAVMVD